MRPSWWSSSPSQLPPFDAMSTAVTHGYFSGYRFLDHPAEPPRFPFGFGLGYTTFSFAQLVVDASGDDVIRLTVDERRRARRRRGRAGLRRLPRIGGRKRRTRSEGVPAGPRRGGRDGDGVL